MNTHRSLLVGLALVVALAGCGDDEESVPSGSEPATAAPSDESPSVTTAQGGGDAPDATVSPDVPSDLAGEVGALEVRGGPLPPLGRDTEVAADPALGMTAPVLVGQDFDGATVRVDAATDGPTMVVFLAHWCPHCNSEVPRLNQLRDEGRFPEGLDIVAVSTAINPGRPNFPPSEWIEDVDWTYPVIADGVDMARGTFIGADAYGVDGFPFTVLLDDAGQVAARWSGEREPDEVMALIDAHLSL